MNLEEKIRSPEKSKKINELSFEKRLELQKKILKIIEINEEISLKKRKDQKFEDLKQELNNFIKDLNHLEASPEETKIKHDKKTTTFNIAIDIKELKRMFADGDMKIIDLKNICKKIKDKLNLI